MEINWKVEPGASEATTVERAETMPFGTKVICPCSVKFQFEESDRYLKEEPVVAKADYDSERYVKIENVRVVPSGTIVFDAVFEAYARRLYFDVRGWTVREGGLDPGGTGKVICTLDVVPDEEVPPPEREELLDTVFFTSRDLITRIEDGIIKMPFAETGFCFVSMVMIDFDLIFFECMYRERLIDLHKVSIVPVERRQPNDPYQGPAIEGRLLNDGSGVRLTVKDTRPRTNYILTVKGMTVLGNAQWVLNATTKNY